MSQFKLDQKLLKKLANKIQKTEKYTREQIRKKANKHKISSQAFFVHWLSEENIGCERYRSLLPVDIQSEVRSVTNQGSAIKHPSFKKKNNAGKITSPFNYKSPFITETDIKNATNNANIYPQLFLFENSLRSFITKVLEKKYGSTWWDSKVDLNIRQRAESHRVKEQMNKWHSSRGIEPIFYVHFPDLAKILKSNVSEFTPFFKGVPNGINWLIQKLGELEFSRNNVAHSCPLKKADLNRFILYFDDWYKHSLQISL